jgi:ABC-type transporter Mla MlaB component
MKQTALSGDLTVREVPAAWQQLAADLPSEVDLGSVERIDSSALALLLELKALAEAGNREIAFTRPPETLRTIARLTQVEQLLGWTETGNAEGSTA